MLLLQLLVQSDGIKSGKATIRSFAALRGNKMEKITMVDMSRSSKEKEDIVSVKPVDAVPDYPYGLCISLCEDELQKLGFQQGELQVGDYVHFHAMACVRSTSENDGPNGPNCRVEMQIEFMSAENESEEDEEAEQEMSHKNGPNKLYKY